MTLIHTQNVTQNTENAFRSELVITFKKTLYPVSNQIKTKYNFFFQSVLILQTLFGVLCLFCNCRRTPLSIVS